MRAVIEFRRCGASYAGSLTPVGGHGSLPFAGILELLAVLERIEADSCSVAGETDSPSSTAGGDQP